MQVTAQFDVIKNRFRRAAMDRPWYKSYAPGIPHSLKFERITLSEVLKRTSQKYPNKVAGIFIDAKFTYRQFNDMVNSFANALLDMGVKPGDKVAMLMPNMPQMMIATYATWRVGGVVVMNNPLYTDTELEHQLNNSESTVLVTMDLLGPRMIALRPKTKVRKIVIAHIRDHLAFPKKQLLPIVAKDKHRDIPKTADVYEWTDLLKKYPAKDPGITVDFDSLASLQYTGGTTGVSKGVMLTHNNLSSNVQQIAAWFPNIKEGEMVIIGVLPFFHSFGLTCVMNNAIWKAGTNVLIPKPEPLTILQAVQKHKVTFYPAVPTMYVGLLNHPDLNKYNLTSIQGCFSGAAPLPIEVIKSFEEKTGSQICEGYGLSETSPVVTTNPWGAKTKAGSIGVPLPDTEIRVVDLEEGTKDMPTGQPGELIIKGPQVTSGYYKMPDETAKTVKDGWLFTGDIGMIDEEGYFFIVDRKKDMIIAGGYNIYPRDIDEVLFQNPKILEACAIGIPDSYRGETVKAFVVLKPGESMTKEEVINFCKEKLAKYKVPTQVEFIDTLPKSGVGKILRKELRSMELAKMKK
jgi:long-chain acyl-CoA synthetase